MADDRLLDYDRATLAAADEQLDDREDDEPQGDDGDTDCRHCTGSELTGHAPDCIQSVLGSMNQHVEQLEQDLEAARGELARIRQLVASYCGGTDPGLTGTPLSTEALVGIVVGRAAEGDIAKLDKERTRG